MLKHIKTECSRNSIFKISSIIILLVLTLSSCKKNFKRTKWEVDLLLPVASADISIKNLAEDSLIKHNSDSSISLIYTDNLYSFSADSLFEIPDTSIEYTAKLSNLDIGEIVVNKRVSLGQIAEADREDNGEFGGLYEAIMTAHNTGNPTVLDPIEQQNFDSTVVEATDYFEEINVLSGFIDITINNQLPIDVTDIIFELKNQSDMSIVLQDTFPVIAVNQEITHTKALTDVHIEGNLLGYLQIASPGSTGEVTIDTNQAISAEIKVYDVSIESATAVFPNQEIVSQYSQASFSEQDYRLNEVLIKEGELNIQIFNTIPQALNYHFKLPGSEKNGNIFEFSGNIAPAQNNHPSYSNISRDLSGYKLNMQGFGFLEQATNTDLNNNGFIDTDTVNSIIYELSGSIDSTGNMVQISLNDSIYLNCSFTGITPDYAQGYIGTDTINQTGTESFDFFSQLRSAEIKLKDANFSMIVKNQIGAQAAIDINLLETQNTISGNQVSLTGNSVFPFEIDKPTNPYSTDISVIPSINTLTLNAQNSNINELLEIIPNKIQYNIDVYTNYNTSPPPLGQETDFLYYGDKISIDLEAEIPLHFISNKLILSDTVEYKLKKDDLNDIETGKLIVNIFNMFPIESKLQIFTIDTINNQVDSLFNTRQIIEPANINLNIGRVSQVTESIIYINVNEDIKNQLLSCKSLIIEAGFVTKPEETYVKIYDYYNLKVTISADFNYKINN